MGFPARSLAARRSSQFPARPGVPDSPLGKRSLREYEVRAQRFRFSEEPGLGVAGAVLEVTVPQVRAAAPAERRFQPFAVAPRARAVPSRPGGVGRGGGGIWRLPCLRMNLRAGRFVE